MKEKGAIQMKIDDLYYQNVQTATGYASVSANRAAAMDKVAEEKGKDALSLIHI